MIPIIGPAQRTPEWYALRRNAENPHFGATDAAGLLGLSQYKTPRHIYERFFRDDETPDNDAMRLGRHLEPAVQSLYAEVHNECVLRDVPTAIHPTQPVFASVDSFVLDSPPSVFKVAGYLYEWSEGEDGFPDTEHDRILEIKTSFSPAVAEQLGEDGSDYVPTDWLCQVQQQMGVLGLSSATIAVLLYGKLRTFRVEANAEVILGIFSAARLMHERILNRDPPPLDWKSPLTPDLVRDMRHDLVGGEWVCDGEAAELWQLQKDIASEITTLEKERALVKAKFEARMIEHEASVGVLPNGKQVVRREMSRKGYTVEPKTFWELREMKARDK